MQKNEQPLETHMEYYKIAYLNDEAAVMQKDIFDEVFSKLEKIQKQALLKRIETAEIQLANLESELSLLIENYTIADDCLS